MDGEVVKCVESGPGVSKGSAGLHSQVPGGMATVSNLAEASGGFRGGAVVTSDIG